MRVQTFEELDTSKVKIIAKVDIRNKTFSKVNVESLHFTDKMVDVSPAQKHFFQQRLYKKDIGLVGDGYQTKNCLLAYGDDHLKSLLEDIAIHYNTKLQAQIDSLKETQSEFNDQEWEIRK